jgi:hypothetical protein
MSNGKAKGSSFEREVAKLLTLWVSGQSKELYYWRSPGSGMMAKLSNQKDMAGDIVPLKEEAKVLTNKFSIEIKTGYAEADLFKHLKQTKNEIVKSFWDQCIRDSRIANKYGILIFRKKGNQPIIGIEESVYKQLAGMDIELSLYILISYGNDLPNLVLMDLSEFLNKVQPLHIKNIS